MRIYCWWLRSSKIFDILSITFSFSISFLFVYKILEMFFKMTQKFVIFYGFGNQFEHNIFLKRIVTKKVINSCLTWRKQEEFYWISFSFFFFHLSSIFRSHTFAFKVMLSSSWIPPNFKSYSIYMGKHTLDTLFSNSSSTISSKVFYFLIENFFAAFFKW